MKSILGSIKTLQDFKLQSRQVSPIYHNAITIPPLLINNLTSQDRIIKQFCGQDAIIKAFYFNLFKLAFQLQNEDKDYGQIVREMLTGYTQFSEGQLQDKNFSDKQYRNFLNEFMDILDSQQIANFQQTIKYYPIVDQILLNIFRKIVPLTLLIKDNKQKIIIDQVLQFLANLFDLRIQKVSQVYKCLQSDIFIYADKLDKIYLVFINQLAFIKEVTQDSISQQRKNIKMNQQSDSNHEIITKQSIQSINSWNNSKQKQMIKYPKKSFSTVISILDNNNGLSTKNNGFSSKICEINQLNSSIQSEKSSKYLEQQKKNKVQNDYYGQISPTQQQNLHYNKQKASMSLSYANSDYNYKLKHLSIDNCSEKTYNSKKSQHGNCSDKQSSSFNDYSKLQNTCSLVESSEHNFSSINPNFKQTLPSASKHYPQEQAKFLYFSTEIFPKKFSHLEVNSNVKQNISQFKLKIEKSKGDQERIEMANESGFSKFTDSRVLDYLDDEFKTQIRHIKKQYRQKRKNIRHI